MYRAGDLVFTNNKQYGNNNKQSADVVAGINPLAALPTANQCSSRQAMGDLIKNVEGGGGCAGTSRL
jgi:hypothetical protein